MTRIPSALAAAGGITLSIAMLAGAIDAFDFRRTAASQVQLPLPLREISDLAVAPDGRLFAVADEAGVIFEVDHRRGRIVKSFALGPPAVLDDFEGLEIVDGRFFLLTSTGLLYETREGQNGAGVQYTRYDTGLRPQCEMEGLASDPSSRSLIIACKMPHVKALQGQITLFRWSLERKQLATPARISVPLATVLRGVKGKSFHPSAVTRMSRTGNYAVLAGRQAMLTEITPAGAVVSTRVLERRLHPQAEGIVFLGDSLAVISDEGGKRNGTLTLYPRAN